MPASDPVIAGFNHSFMLVSLSVGVMRALTPRPRSAARSLSRALLHQSREFLEFLVTQVGDRPIIEISRGPFNDVVAVPGGSPWRSKTFTLARCHKDGDLVIATAIFESSQIAIGNVVF
jgi:hypothetical protein